MLSPRITSTLPLNPAAVAAERKVSMRATVGSAVDGCAACSGAGGAQAWARKKSRSYKYVRVDMNTR